VLQKYSMFVLVHFDRILDYKHMNNVFHIHKYAVLLTDLCSSVMQ